MGDLKDKSLDWADRLVRDMTDSDTLDIRTVAALLRVQHSRSAASPPSPALPSREAVARVLFNQSVYHGYDKATLAAEWARMKGIHLSTADRILALFTPQEPMPLATVELVERKTQDESNGRR